MIRVPGVSNLLQWLLKRYEKATLGVLLGLLVGAVVGLWPFQEAVPPEPGQVIKGRSVTVDNTGTFDPEDWPLERFEPDAGQLAAALGLVLAGLGTTALIGRVGREAAEAEETRDSDSSLAGS